MFLAEYLIAPGPLWRSSEEREEGWGWSLEQKQLLRGLHRYSGLPHILIGWVNCGWFYWWSSGGKQLSGGSPRKYWGPPHILPVDDIIGGGGGGGPFSHFDWFIDFWLNCHQDQIHLLKELHSWFLVTNSKCSKDFQILNPITCSPKMYVYKSSDCIWIHLQFFWCIW